MEAVIPPRSTRKVLRSYNARLYRERPVVECVIGKFKHSRRLFSSFETLARRYLGFLHFVEALALVR